LVRFLSISAPLPKRLENHSYQLRKYLIVSNYDDEGDRLSGVGMADYPIWSIAVDNHCPKIICAGTGVGDLKPEGIYRNTDNVNTCGGRHLSPLDSGDEVFALATTFAGFDPHLLHALERENLSVA
jgi:hypothetical protein